MGLHVILCAKLRNAQKLQETKLWKVESFDLMISYCRKVMSSVKALSLILSAVTDAVISGDV